MHLRTTRSQGIVVLAFALAACGGAIPDGTPPSDPSAAPDTPASATPPVASDAPRTPTPLVTPAATPGETVDAAEAEAALLHGARLDLQGRCVPLRGGLPPGAVGAITCTPRSTIATTVTMTILGTRTDLMAAYHAAVASEAIPPFTHGGRCEAGRATEGGYVPGDGHPGFIPDERVACWIDDAGIAHSVTTSLPFVLLRVDGHPGASTADVDRFAMLGSRDQPGGPTLWAEEPMNPEK